MLIHIKGQYCIAAQESDSNEGKSVTEENVMTFQILYAVSTASQHEFLKAG